MKSLNLFVFFMLFLFVAGCGPSYYYKYTPPKNSEGISCVQRCSQERSSCRHTLALEEKNEMAISMAEERSYQNCAAGRDKEDIKKYCRHIGRMGSDPFFNHYGGPTCEDDFNQCFEICGGNIEKILQQ